MIVFKLVSKARLSYSKEHSFGDKSRPADFTALHIGFVRIIRPMKEEAFSKYFKMYLGDDYEWHHKVRKEVKKQRSKLTAYYDNRYGENLREKQEKISSMHKQILGLKEDISALVRTAKLVDIESANTIANDKVNNPITNTSSKLSKAVNKNDIEKTNENLKTAANKVIDNRVNESANTVNKTE